MTTIAEWLELTGGRLSADDICVDAKFVGRLDKKHYKGWLIREEDAADYQDWYPIQVDWPGHMIRAYYFNLNRRSPRHGQLYCLAVFFNDEIEFKPSGRIWRVDDPATPRDGVGHVCTPAPASGSSSGSASVASAPATDEKAGSAAS